MRVVSLFLMVMMTQAIAAQGEPRAVFDTETLVPATGQPVTLTLLVYTPPGYEVVFPTLPERWGDFTVLEVGQPAIGERGVEIVHSIELRAVPWGMGDVSTPLTQVTVRGDGTEEVITVEPFFFQIPSVLDDLPELRRRRAFIQLTYIPIWSIGLGGVGVAVAAAWGSVVFLRWRERRASGQVARKVQRTLGARTVQALRRLEYDAPDWQSQVSGMGDTLRVYVMERYAVEPDATTEELLDEVVPSVHDADMLSYLLHQSEQAKFAPSTVTGEVTKPVVELAISWVRGAERERI